MKKLLLSILFVGFLFTFSNAVPARVSGEPSLTETTLENGTDLSDKQVKSLLKSAARELSLPPGQVFNDYRNGDITITSAGNDYYQVDSKKEGWGLLILLEEL